MLIFVGGCAEGASWTKDLSIREMSRVPTSSVLEISGSSGDMGPRLIDLILDYMR